MRITRDGADMSDEYDPDDDLDDFTFTDQCYSLGYREGAKFAYTHVLDAINFLATSSIDPENCFENLENAIIRGIGINEYQLDKIKGIIEDEH